MSIHWGGRGAGHVSRWSTTVSSVALSIDFLSGTLDPRITFTRGTTATLVDTTGNISYAPANMLLRSEEFDNASWVKAGQGAASAPVVTANAGTAPDGTLTADRLQLTLNAGTASGDISSIAQGFLFTSGPSIFSVYIKSNTASTYVMQITRPDGNAASITVTPTWQRFNSTVITATGNVNYAIRLRGNQSPTNSSSADILVWGAQLEPVTYQTAPSTYIATTASAYYGPRFDYDPVTLAAKGLLIEEARTNLFLNSLTSGVPLSTQTVTVTAVPHTISFYGTGTVTLTGAAIASVVGTGVYPNRRTLTFTPTAGALICTVTGSVQFAQIEVGSFATSFIPTTTATVSRSADVATMTGTNFSSWYSQTQGSFIAAFSTLWSGAAPTSMGILGFDSSGSKRVAYVAQSSQTPSTFDGTSLVTVANVLAAGVNKLSSAYDTSRYIVLNGGTVASGAMVAGYPVSTSFNIGAYGSSPLNGHVRSLTYYKSRLSNAQLQALTA